METVFSKEMKYFQHVDVRSYDADGAFRLKAEAFMNYAQEIAYRAATHLGFGFDELQARGAAWVLSRMHFVFCGSPKWRDSLSMYTWHKGLGGPFFLRDFELLDASGERVVAGTSSWVVLDTSSRRLVRVSQLDGLVTEDSQCADNAIEEPAPKIVFPKGAEGEYAGGHTVSYSDIDIVGHTNNVKYVSWALDCIGYEEVAARGVREVFVNFNHETHPGETVKLFRHHAEDGSWYIEETVDGKCVASVRVILG